MKSRASGADNELETFLVHGTQALAADALGVASATKEPHAWAWALLAVAAERMAYECRQRMSPEAYEAARRAVIAHTVGVRNAANDMHASRQQGSRLIAAALSCDEAEPAEIDD